MPGSEAVYLAQCIQRETFLSSKSGVSPWHEKKLSLLTQTRETQKLAQKIAQNEADGRIMTFDIN